MYSDHPGKTYTMVIVIEFMRLGKTNTHTHTKGGQWTDGA